MCLLCIAEWVHAESEEEFYTHLLQLKPFLLSQHNILCLCRIVRYLIEGKCVISVSFQRVLFLQHRDAGLHLNAVTARGQRGAVLQQSLAAMAGIIVIKQNAVCPTGFLDSHCCYNRGFFFKFTVSYAFIIPVIPSSGAITPILWREKKDTLVVTMSIRL